MENVTQQRIDFYSDKTQFEMAEMILKQGIQYWNTINLKDASINYEELSIGQHEPFVFDFGKLIGNEFSIDDKIELLLNLLSLKKEINIENTTETTYENCDLCYSRIFRNQPIWNDEIKPPNIINFDNLILKEFHFWDHTLFELGAFYFKDESVEEPVMFLANLNDRRYTSKGREYFLNNLASSMVLSDSINLLGDINQDNNLVKYKVKAQPLPLSFIWEDKPMKGMPIYRIAEISKDDNSENPNHIKSPELVEMFR